MVPIVVGKYTAPATVPVPNASGMKSDTARQMLEKQGWKVNIEERPVGDSRQAGMVLQQMFSVRPRSTITYMYLRAHGSVETYVGSPQTRCAALLVRGDRACESALAHLQDLALDV